MVADTAVARLNTRLGNQSKCATLETDVVFGGAGGSGISDLFGLEMACIW